MNMPDHGDLLDTRGRRIGVLGGSFDPIHIGHLVIAEAARCELGLGRVLFMPARAQPFKLDWTTAPPEHRLAMVQAAIAGNEAFAASRIELDRKPPSYTADTLRLLDTQADGAPNPERRLFFICGADALLDMHDWYHPEVILRHATIAVADRPGCGDERALRLAASELTGQFGGEVVFFDAPRLDVSSSEIRERLAGRRSVRYLVPEAVLAYLSEHRLYGAGT